MIKISTYFGNQWIIIKLIFEEDWKIEQRTLAPQLVHLLFTSLGGAWESLFPHNFSSNAMPE